MIFIKPFYLKFVNKARGEKMEERNDAIKALLDKLEEDGELSVEQAKHLYHEISEILKQVNKKGEKVYKNKL
jgi:polyhydroxyalkanoate synthesis regulator phasin